MQSLQTSDTFVALIACPTLVEAATKPLRRPKAVYVPDPSIYLCRVLQRTIGLHWKLMKKEQKISRESLLNGEIQQLAADRPGLINLMPDDVREQLVRETIADAPDKSEFRIFAYGSLIWNPAIEIESTYRCNITGYHRSFCFWTLLGRGCEKQPGLMMGLESGGRCEGVAYSIAQDKLELELDILFRREMMSYAYKPTWVTADYDANNQPASGSEVLAFVVNPENDRYCNNLDEETLVRSLALAEGPLGKNCDYLYQLVEHLEALGYDDPEMTTLAEKVRTFQSTHQP